MTSKILKNRHRHFVIQLSSFFGTLRNDLLSAIAVLLRKFLLLSNEHQLIQKLMQHYCDRLRADIDRRFQSFFQRVVFRTHCTAYSDILAT
jgi:hypothetical protein